MLFLLASMEVEALSVRESQNEFLERLLMRIASADTDALEALYLATKSSVYGFARSIVKQREQAEDVMQETYVTIFLSAQQYRAQGKPMAWILTIVRNQSLMKLREARHFVDDYDIDVSQPQQDDFTQRSLDRMVLRTAIAVLAEDEWQIVSLHSLSGLKHREIAELLGIPLSTTLSKYRRALAKLQKALKEETIE